MELVLDSLAAHVEVGCSQAVVGSEGVNVHGSSSVDGAQQDHADRFVQTVEEGLGREKYPNF